jgi:hypothetical protein
VVADPKIGRRRAHFEQVLLVLQALFLFIAQLAQAVVVPVEIDQLVVALDTRFADLFADVVELFARLDNARVDELELGRERF